jgi:hypothetical protein
MTSGAAERLFCRSCRRPLPAEYRDRPRRPCPHCGSPERELVRNPPTKEESMSEESNTRVVKEIYDAFGRGDVDRS